MSPSNHPLIAPMRQLRAHPGMASARAFISLARVPSLWHLRASWGDTALGGSLGLLDLAADLGLPSVLRRGLQAGLHPTWRTHVLAWRSRCPRCIALLASHTEPPVRPWPDPQLHKDAMHAQARTLARALRAGAGPYDLAPVTAERF